MSLEIMPSIEKQLPMTVKSSLAKMSTEQQMLFQDQFKKKSKSTALLVVLAILIPIQMFLLGKPGLGIVFRLTGGGLGIWYIIKWFVTPKRVRDYNEDVATKVLMEIKILNSQNKTSRAAC